MQGCSSTPRLDAEVLLALALECNRTHLYAEPQRLVGDAAAATIEALLRRRIAGEPIAYLTGVREFWSLPFAVGEGVLVPRPETEHLVECVLAHIKQCRRPVIADLGSGSGAIAIALAKTRPDALLIAVDNDRQCLKWAVRNCAAIGAPKVLLVQGDWCAALARGVFDVVAANPPYLATGDAALDSDGVRFEPRAALVAEEAGLAAIRQIIHHAPACLAQHGALFLEHGALQGATVRRLLQKKGFARVRTVSDLAGLERVSLGLRYAA